MQLENPPLGVVSAPERSGKDLIDATRPYAVEQPGRTAWAVLNTFVPLAAALALAAWRLPPWPARAAASVLASLLTVRGFILYHDVMHGALLRGSRLGRALFSAYGVLVLTPPRVWKQTHNYHHANTAKIVGSHVGSYMMLTTEMYRKATPAQRLAYRATRHPLTVLFGYFTVFLYGMCAAGFARNPRKNWDSLLALVVHFGLSFALWRYAGPDVMFFALTLPLALACAQGAYLFYAQHNFPDMVVQPRESWSYTRAALESSSYMPMSPAMAWFTGNIGYHHVHHLNSSIPFYRLPEAMARVPELAHPHETSLHPRDVLACFRLKLWDPAAGRMVGYPADVRGSAV